MATNLAQTRKRRKHMDLASSDAVFVDALEYLLAAAAKLGQIKFALFISEFAIATLFNAIRKVLGNLSL